MYVYIYIYDMKMCHGCGKLGFRMISIRRRDILCCFHIVLRLHATLSPFYSFAMRQRWVSRLPLIRLLSQTQNGTFLFTFQQERRYKGKTAQYKHHVRARTLIKNFFSRGKTTMLRPTTQMLYASLPSIKWDKIRLWKRKGIPKKKEIGVDTNKG